MIERTDFTPVLKHIVIVGSGQAAAMVAVRLRELGFEGRITMLAAEDRRPYERPPLTKAFLKGNVRESDLELYTKARYAELEIDLQMACTATKIDPVARTLSHSQGRLDYDGLVLATGASARCWPRALVGELAGVHSIRRIEDAQQLSAAMRPGMRLLVISGGFLGLEAAATAAQLGLAVTVVEIGTRILQRVASAELSSDIRDVHLENGVKILKRTVVEKLLRRDCVTGAAVAGGLRIDTDLVLVAIGATPNEKIARDAGIAVSDGIQTDLFGRTSQNGIWAVGDCASLPFGGRRLRLENVQNAIDSAQIAAADIVGKGEAYMPVPTFYSQQFDRLIQIVGLGGEDNRVVARPGSDDKSISYWHYREGQLCAVEAINNSKTFAIARRMIADGKSPSVDEVVDPKVNLKHQLRR